MITGRKTPRDGERGSAMVIAVLVMAILTLLGVSYLLMADTENKIAQNEKLSAQALYFGEGVVREVKRWFDRPPYGTTGDWNISRPTVGVMVRTQRQIDSDGDGPTAPVNADGSIGAPYYKVGVDRDADGNDDIFDKPYRSLLGDMLVGTATGPDVRMDRSANGATATFLDALAEKVMPNFPAAGAGIRARIRTIDVYGPPYIDTGGGNWVRFGMATVSARVQILKNPGAANELVMADRTVTAVLNETPYPGPFGPLHSCDELKWNGEFKVHWGPGTAKGLADLQNSPGNKLAKSIPRDEPPTARLDLLHGHLSPAGDATWTDMVTNLQGKTIEDPWFQFFAGGDVVDWAAHVAPPSQLNVPITTDQDESNRYENFPSVPCPEFEYETWKAIAQSGGSDVHYYAWDNGTQFIENGVGATREFEDITDGQTGLFFFDTADGIAPHGFDASNLASNLTPEIDISGGSYGARGFLYVNTEMWRVTGSPGRAADFTFPGEPFRDENENGVFDPGTEEWINLRYTGMTDIFDQPRVDSGDTWSTGTVVRNNYGPTISHTAIVWGVLYITGQFDAQGTPVYNGSVVTKAGTPTGGFSAGTADLFWDPKLKDNWPPPGWNLPRVVITRWQTDL